MNNGEPCGRCPASRANPPAAEGEALTDRIGKINAASKVAMEKLAAIVNLDSHEFKAHPGRSYVDRDAVMAMIPALRDSIFAIVGEARALAAHPRAADQVLAKRQPCGCVICTCEDPVQCHGCGAEHCGKHPVGEFDAPVYESAHPRAAGEPARALRMLTQEELQSCIRKALAEGGSFSDEVQRKFCQVNGLPVADERGTSGKADAPKGGQ